MIPFTLSLLLILINGFKGASIEYSIYMKIILTMEHSVTLSNTSLPGVKVVNLGRSIRSLNNKNLLDSVRQAVS